MSSAELIKRSPRERRGPSSYTKSPSEHAAGPADPAWCLRCESHRQVFSEFASDVCRCENPHGPATPPSTRYLFNDRHDVTKRISTTCSTRT